ncbi:hypothetical protein ACJMK2_036538 [Sinanodonta woodiana]|uniref:Uncharacterized protein n=1 Tax=Sinanodonta woodiana TaxID=1069815 RepID=A0ABD3WL30_SINWO
MANPRILAFAVILGLKLVTSSPVYPILSLDQFDPVDACLFICNICYDDFGSQMMKCANNICMSGKYSFNLGMLEIGRNCKHFDKIQKYMFGSGNKIE